MRSLLTALLLILPISLHAQSASTSSETTNIETQSTAQTSCVAPKIDTATAPLIDGQPVEVKLGFSFTDILGISDPDQNIQVDIAQLMEWTDPRLANLSGCLIGVPDIWTPRLELLNSSSLSPKYTQARNQVEIFEGGRVRYVQRYSGTISTYHNLKHFPFDKQVFTFNLISPLYPADEVIISPWSEKITMSEKLNIEDWSFENIAASNSIQEFHSFEKPHSVMTVELSAYRHVLYYFYKVLIPLALIVSMSWVIFWIKPSNFEGQIGFGATSMLTLIAFQFGLINSLPKLNYFTSMDFMVFGSTVLVYAAILEALLTGVLYRRGKEHVAQKIDVVCRVAFPIVFLSFWAFIIMTSY